MHFRCIFLQIFIFQLFLTKKERRRKTSAPLSPIKKRKPFTSAASLRANVFGVFSTLLRSNMR